MGVKPDNAIHGRMRQRIVVLVGPHARRNDPRQHKRGFRKDKFLHRLLRSGTVTQDQLSSVMSRMARMPSEYGWLRDVDDTVLGKADCVFFTEHGRFPLEDSDFRLNGGYYKICRSLQYDLHYYDRKLETVAAAPEKESQELPGTGAEVAEDVSGQEGRRGKFWVFGFVLALGFVSAPVLGLTIVKFFPANTGPATLLVGGGWLLFMVIALLLTFPRSPD